MKCKKCGTEFEGKFCPSCGSQVDSSTNATVGVQQENVKTKKPFYKKWWFILIAIIVVIVIGNNVFGGEKINWSQMELGKYLPEPSSKKGKAYYNSDDELWIELYKVSEDKAKDYIDECKEKGFTIEADSSSTGYEAYNSDGYSLDLSWYSDKLSIKLEAPMKLSTIKWPTSTVGQLLPKPASTLGKFSYEYDDNFFVYIGNTTKDDFSEYVEVCSEKGFNVDYNKGDTYYYADNVDGYHISLKYEGNNTMSIDIDSPDEEDSTSNNSSNETITTPSETKKEETDNKNTNNNDKNTSNNVGLDSDFKEAMDSYEEFMDEYVAFMKKYKNSNGTDISLIADYAKYMSKYTDMCDDFAKWEDEEMNAAEAAYYIKVQTRVNKKLLEVAY